MNKPVVQRSAEMSLDLRYRYRLDRVWDPKGSICLFCGINPSDADGQRDDPTVTRSMGFARRWGHGGLVWVNLAAFVDSHPKVLTTSTTDPIGPNNDVIIVEAARQAMKSGGQMIAAWGRSVDFEKVEPLSLRHRDLAVLGLLTSVGNVHCLRKLKNGAPGHPLARGGLRIADDALPIPFAMKREV